MILNDHVARQRAVVRHDDVIPHLAVMSHVGVTKQKIVIAYACRRPLFGASVHGRIFSKNIMVADLKTCWLTKIFQILRFSANCSKGKKLVVISNSAWAIDHYVGMQHASVPQLHTLANHAVRTNDDINT
jgi:hypothetical protein